MASSKQGGIEFWLIPNVGTFLPKLFRLFACDSNDSGKEENHGMSITSVEAKLLQKTYLAFHQRDANKAFLALVSHAEVTDVEWYIK